MPFGKLIVLLITSFWNVCSCHFLAWLHPLVKRYFADLLTRRFIEKYLLRRKFARNPLKAPVKEQQQKFTLHDLLSFTWNFQAPDNLVPRAILKLTTIFVNPWKNQKYLLIINMFTPLLQMKLFWRNNIAFTGKRIIYLLVLYLKLAFPNFTSQLISTVEQSISCILFFFQLCGWVQKQLFGGARESTCDEKRLEKFQQTSSFFN